MRDAWNGSSGRRRIAGLGLTAMLASHSFARETESIPVAAAPVLEDRYPARVVKFPRGVTGSADLVYSTIDGFRPLTLDLHVPRRPTAAPPAPLVVFVHGGAWKAGHSRQSGAFENWPGALASLAARGYVVSSVNYRLSGEAPFPAALSDVKNAIRWLRARAGEFGIDPETFSRALESAGAKAELLLIPGADHSFIGANADATRRNSHLALQRTFDFIAATLNPDKR